MAAPTLQLAWRHVGHATRESEKLKPSVALQAEAFPTTSASAVLLRAHLATLQAALRVHLMSIPHKTPM